MPSVAVVVSFVLHTSSPVSRSTRGDVGHALGAEHLAVAGRRPVGADVQVVVGPRPPHLAALEVDGAQRARQVLDEDRVAEHDRARRGVAVDAGAGERHRPRLLEPVDRRRGDRRVHRPRGSRRGLGPEPATARRARSVSGAGPLSRSDGEPASTSGATAGGGRGRHGEVVGPAPGEGHDATSATIARDDEAAAAIGGPGIGATVAASVAGIRRMAYCAPGSVGSRPRRSRPVPSIREVLIGARPAGSPPARRRRAASP